MHVTHRKRFVSRDLVALAARRPQELATLSEAHYHDQIESIADEVLAAGQRIVMLTGPSAAGKTTSAHKIADAIAACGHRSQVISLDDFYIGEGKYPKNPDGSDDYESLEALDLERLHACLKALYKTGVCDAPVFDFTIQRPSGTQRIDARDGVVIIEGLHALNPALTEELPEDAALCLYAGLREEYADSRDARCLATRDIRLHAVWCGTACSAATAQRSRWGCGATSARARTAISSPTSPAPISCWTRPIPTRSACGVPCWTPCRQTRR